MHPWLDTALTLLCLFGAYGWGHRHGRKQGCIQAARALEEAEQHDQERAVPFLTPLERAVMGEIGGLSDYAENIYADILNARHLLDEHTKNDDDRELLQKRIDCLHHAHTETVKKLERAAFKL